MKSKFLMFLLAVVVIALQIGFVSLAPFGFTTPVTDAAAAVENLTTIAAESEVTKVVRFCVVPGDTSSTTLYFFYTSKGNFMFIAKGMPATDKAVEEYTDEEKVAVKCYALTLASVNSQTISWDTLSVALLLLLVIIAIPKYKEKD